jgi:hypothetical protein
MTFDERDRKASPECLDGNALWTAGAIAERGASLCNGTQTLLDALKA